MTYDRNLYEWQHKIYSNIVSLKFLLLLLGIALFGILYLSFVGPQPDNPYSPFISSLPLIILDIYCTSVFLLAQRQLRGISKKEMRNEIKYDIEKYTEITNTATIIGFIIFGLLFLSWKVLIHTPFRVILVSMGLVFVYFFLIPGYPKDGKSNRYNYPRNRSSDSQIEKEKQSKEPYHDPRH